jgi:hypothetical protein
MCSAVEIGWEDGPTTKMVDDLVGKYHSSDFDGMIDLKSYRSHWLLPDGTIEVALIQGSEGSGGQHPRQEFEKPHPDAEEVSLASDYVTTHRSHSREFVHRTAEKFSAKFGISNADELTRCYYAGTKVEGTSHGGPDDFNRFVWTMNGYTEPDKKKDTNKKLHSPDMPVIGSFKGYPTIVLSINGGKKSFTFGLAKAKAILENLDAIKTFVESDGKHV